MGSENGRRTMKAMALAAGKGTRLFPPTGELPKPPAPGGDHPLTAPHLALLHPPTHGAPPTPPAPVVAPPIIGHIFGLLAKHGIGEVHVNIHYLADTLLEAYGEESRSNGMKVNLNRENELLGTAGGVKRLAGHFEDTFVVVSGDALTDIDIGELVTFHREKGALAPIDLRRVYDTSASSD